jgi:hypothetical protein
LQDDLIKEDRHVLSCQFEKAEDISWPREFVPPEEVDPCAFFLGPAALGAKSLPGSELKFRARAQMPLPAGRTPLLFILPGSG